MQDRGHGARLAAIAALALAACAPGGTDSGPDAVQEAVKSVGDDASIHPERWPAAASPELAGAARVEARVSAIMASMTLSEKVGQMIQADIASIKPEDLLTYRLGSVLNGGNSAPGGDNRVHPSAYLALADALYAASVHPAGGAAAIPVLWGTDAVHGHNNIFGATLFPHNIGLGAARDGDLMRRIAEATAREVRVTGMDWTFAPTLAVVRDDRWGRTYESFSEDPAIVAAYAGAIVEGLQGAAGAGDFLGEDHVIATAKHFLGDGGTDGGKDQGDTLATEEDLRDLHAAGYKPAILAGVQTVMASFNSWRGAKLHGDKDLLTGVLKERMGFDGFVVGDWNGHGQVTGCTNESCAAAFNAGLDMAMAPDSWKALYANTLAQAESGEIPMARIDDAVRRILRVKVRSGLFDRPRPAARAGAARYEILGAPAHRAVAREAARKSLVLLKNDGGVLPLDPRQRFLVAGDAADDIGRQSGGWSLTWQGEGNTNADFPQGTSIYAGLAEAINAGGGEAILSPGGAFDEAPDAAIVIFGETPYAEFQGDRADVGFDDERPLEILKRLKDAGIPTVSVFLSGRPLYVNAEINHSDAFVAAWLPGTEGAGVADVLIADATGKARHDFVGKLSFSWPKTPAATPLNVGDIGYDPEFAFGYGLSYADDQTIGALVEAEIVCAAAPGSVFLSAGRARAPYRMALEADGAVTPVEGPIAAAAGAVLAVRAVDRTVQEDARALLWRGPAAFVVSGVQQDLTRQANARMALVYSYAVTDAPEGAVRVGVRLADGTLRFAERADAFKKDVGKGWRQGEVPLTALLPDEAERRSISAPFVIESDGPFGLQIADVRISMGAGDTGCDPQ